MQARMPALRRRLKRGDCVELISHARHDSMSGENLTTFLHFERCGLVYFRDWKSNDLRGIFFITLRAHGSERLNGESNDITGDVHEAAERETGRDDGFKSNLGTVRNPPPYPKGGAPASRRTKKSWISPIDTTYRSANNPLPCAITLMLSP